MRSPRSPTSSWSAIWRASRSPTRRSSTARSRAPTTARCSPSCAASPRATSAPTACSTRSSRTCPRRSSTARSQVGDVELAPPRTRELFAYVFKTRADPFAGRINLLRVYQGVLRHDTQVLNTRAHVERADRPADRVLAARTASTSRVRPGRHRRRRQAQGHARRRLARRRATSRSRCRARACRRR